ncbi:MAG: dihydrolipoyl dehydrogenase [Candidatus Tectomicrobia bacterium]|nr:dihydrolipoyl dehydrogenase [Candidatus Tectomicrobia bacterium]
MAETQHACDLIVMGGGPGGYVAAIRAAQLGMNVSLVERDTLGGICLNWGCIPTKALLRNAEIYQLMQRGEEFGLLCDNVRVDFDKVIRRSRQVAERLTKGVAFLMRKNKINVINGMGRLAGAGVVTVHDADGVSQATLRAPHIILATGARPRELPGLPFDHPHVVHSSEAMILSEIPESLAIIGAGAIGVEFAYLYNTFGSRVTLIEMLPQILSVEDHEISQALHQSLTKQGIDILVDSRVDNAGLMSDGVRLQVRTPDGERTIESSKVLVAIGVQGNIEQLGLDTAGVHNERGFIPVDAQCRTNVQGIYAIGDVNGPPCLAHVASAEGIATVEAIAGQDTQGVNRQNIPGCTYCQPQVASVGLTETAAREAGHDIRIGRFPFQASGKALAVGESEGLVKVIFDTETDELLGAHIIGSEATDLIAEVGIARTLETTHYEILKTVHAHPTLSEAIMEAVGDAYDEAIHI